LGTFNPSLAVFIKALLGLLHKRFSEITLQQLKYMPVRAVARSKTMRAVACKAQK
jgi:hypothetical protein